LGLGYLASILRCCGYQPQLLDCTFLSRKEAHQRAREAKADVVGIYSMVSMLQESLNFARIMRDHCDLLVAGGPLPSCAPDTFLDDFDLVVMGEGEKTVLEIVRAYEGGLAFNSIKGLKYRNKGAALQTQRRELQIDLDNIPFPARDLFPNQKYIDHWKKRFGYSTTTVITTRGCPFACEFCSNAVFGITYRERSPNNVLDEVEQALALGYDRIHFADDVFTLNRRRVMEICQEILARGIEFEWECLGRVDSIDKATSEAMKKAGCDRIFFGIESGDESILRLMSKMVSLHQARRAVEAAKAAGLKTGAFFILCYPGETDETVLRTIKFAASLPLDYLSFTIPYPLPGTRLFERIKGQIVGEWNAQSGPLSDHPVIFKSEFSKAKMRFAIFKGEIEFAFQRNSGSPISLAKMPFEKVTDIIFKAIK